ncbi:hypothetical protein CROQUDRAFT_668745 [Cronartium quercuum f. sp. fusiforme G11]|uniref:Uncharacterized protein n=1 Tax=Cronartium quercuum f. sp. fusiforme G11 TaxID=708437 RepID=A0A9P6NN86_9BASI|nr:hypothetical protein CROQUDRAFT_668745 [Cronartium quercuum f. sp. fusiforme G11]
MFSTPAFSQTRNIVYPSTNSSTQTQVASGTNPVASSSVTPAPKAGGVNNTVVNGTTGSNQSSLAATSTVPLSKIPDSTGINNVPVPGMTGGRANGRYGPDDGYIAAVGHLIIPISLSVGAVVVAMVVIGFGL